MANEHRVFEIVYPTEDNRCIGKQFLVMCEQEIKGMVIRGDNDVKSAIPEFMPI